MESLTKLAPSKPPCLETNYALCLVCQQPGEPLVNQPGDESYKKLLSFISEWATYGEGDFPSIWKDLKICPQKHLRWKMHHGTVAVTVELVTRETQRAKLQYENAVEKQDISLLERRKGHPSSRSTISSTFCSSMEATDLTTHLKCFMANPFNKEFCFFCQEDKQNLGMFHEVCQII